MVKIFTRNAKNKKKFNNSKTVNVYSFKVNFVHHYLPL
jgi:hypothetical protein